MKDKANKLTGFIVALLIGPTVACAAPVIYDFEGTGTASAYGVLSFPDHDQVNFDNYTGVHVSGWISIDLGASKPNEFHIVASGGTKTGCANCGGFFFTYSTPPADPSLLETNSATVSNGSTIDTLRNSQNIIRQGDNWFWRQATLMRTGDSSWLSGDLFPLDVGLGPGSNILSFIFQDQSFLKFGRSGTFELTSLVLREGDVVATPIPAALPLFGSVLGLMGFVGWWRRRRAEAVGLA